MTQILNISGADIAIRTRQAVEDAIGKSVARLETLYIPPVDKL